MSDPEYRHVAALGSSFASGPGIEPIEDRAARRSARNYPHLLAETLGAALTDLTVAGATTATIIDTPQRSLLRKFPPQLDGLPGTADLVTITAGGNDLNYIGAMTRLAVAARLAGNVLTRQLSSLMSRTGVPVPSRDDVELAAANLVRIVEAVTQHASGAHIVLVDYLTVIGEHTTTSDETPFPASTLDVLRRLGDTVSEVFTLAAGKTGATLVPMRELSAGHALGSAAPWVTGMPARLRDLSERAPFHPNATGMRAVADAIVGRLRG